MPKLGLLLTFVFGALLGGVCELALRPFALSDALDYRPVYDEAVPLATAHNADARPRFAVGSKRQIVDGRALRVPALRNDGGEIGHDPMRALRASVLDEALRAEKRDASRFGDGFDRAASIADKFPVQLAERHSIRIARTGAWPARDTAERSADA